MEPKLRDVASRLSSLTYDGQSFASNIVYNAASQTTSLSVGTGTNQVNESYRYNAQTGLLDGQTATRNGATLLNLSYDYAGANGKRSGQVMFLITPAVGVGVLFELIGSTNISASPAQAN